MMCFVSEPTKYSFECRIWSKMRYLSFVLHLLLIFLLVSCETVCRRESWQPLSENFIFLVDLCKLFLGVRSVYTLIVTTWTIEMLFTTRVHWLCSAFKRKCCWPHSRIRINRNLRLLHPIAINFRSEWAESSYVSNRKSFRVFSYLSFRSNSIDL